MKSYLDLNAPLWEEFLTCTAGSLILTAMEPGALRVARTGIVSVQTQTDTGPAAGAPDWAVLITHCPATSATARRHGGSKDAGWHASMLSICKLVRSHCNKSVDHQVVTALTWSLLTSRLRKLCSYLLCSRNWCRTACCLTAQ